MIDLSISCLKLLLLWSLYYTRILTNAFYQCHEELGGGICPDGNTCCRRQDGSSGCIASDMGRFNATCCDDGETGCALGYGCRSMENDCIALDVTPYTDPLVQVLPRYRLCNAQGMEHLHGLTVAPGAELAYYSSHGPIQNIVQSVDFVLVIVHGKNRNADDYFCSAQAAIDLQTTYSNVLLIAPRFLADTDDRSGDSFVFWNDEGSGPWRYGADSTGPRHVSSYDAFDLLVDSIWEQFPSLPRLVVAGHSSGGQFVQRWSLLTKSWTQRMHSVVANPSSFAFLQPFRFVDGSWIVPDPDVCPQYNQWEWGLDDGGDIEVPYRKRAVWNVSGVIDRFRDRRVVYLAGSQDRCNTSAVDGWCHSHDMETSCMDEVQGRNRYERSARYVASLRKLGIWHGHKRQVVRDVGHDHSLMFQSPVGLEAIFGRASNTQATTSQ